MATTKRKVVSDDTLEIMPIGAGNEVGRSCILMKFKGKSIMFDCGIHPAYTGLSSLPYFDMIDDPSTIDLLLISHFHLDHAAALPYFLEKTSFKGKVYMTHPTKAIYKMLLADYVKVSNIAVEDMLFDEQDLMKSMDKIEQINYHQEIEHNGIKFTCYNAGHVLGAAMFLVEIAGVKLLYTGDFSRQEDRHLMAAETPPVKVDVLIVESTYGVQVHEPRVERERRFTSNIHDIVRRGGRCLIPVFALGRAQELLLILDEYWNAHPELQNIPIYYASSLAKKCMTVYQTYINMMNDRIRSQFDLGNPFKFKNISNLKSMEHFDDIGPCVVMASPGMLQSGLSRELFEKWCFDKRNGVVLPGYCVEGTLAKHIMSEPPDIMTSAGVSVPLNMSVTYISFSAHSDFLQTSEFIDILQPPHVILVHGDANEMARLKASLVTKYESRNMQVHTPKNCQAVQLVFRAEKIAKTVGALAAPGPKQGRRISGVLVQKDFGHTIMSATELPTYTQLKTNVIMQKQQIAFHHSLGVLQHALQQMYDDVSATEGQLSIYGTVSITIVSPLQLTFEWVSNPVSDMIADSALAIILQLEANPLVPDSTIKQDNVNPTEIIQATKSERATKPESEHQRVAHIKDLLSAQYGEVVYDENAGQISVSLDDTRAVVDLSTLTVECTNAALKGRVCESLNRIKLAVFPVTANDTMIKD